MGLKARLLSIIKEAKETEATITVTTEKSREHGYTHSLGEGYTILDLNYHIDMVINSHIELMKKPDLEVYEMVTKIKIENVYRFGFLKERNLSRNKI